jgi:hypothetical protein
VNEEPTKRTIRSPSYPGIGLAAAIGRAEELYERENRLPASVPTVLKHWGYSPKSGPGFSTLAAVKQFGLIEDEGRGDVRRVRLSSLGLRIVQDKRPGSPERQDAIRQAALHPTVYADLWREFGAAASDDNLEYSLLTKHFSDSAAKDIVRGYRAAIALANLHEGDTVTLNGDSDSEDQGDGSDEERRDSSLRDGLRKPKRAGMKTYAIPVDPDNDALIELPVPMTTERWENFKAFLAAMERVILDDTHRDPEPTEEG